MKYNKFCTIQSSTSNGRFQLLRMGTKVVASPIWVIYDFLTDSVISQGKYKWVSERWRAEYLSKHKGVMPSTRSMK